MRHNQNHKAPKNSEECAACKAEQFYDKATKIVKNQKLLAIFKP